MALARRLWWLGALSCRCSAWQYGMIMDAGSGGTRLHVFNWPKRVADPLHPQNPAITIPEELFHVEVHPGISVFAHNVSGLKPYLDRLLDRVKKRLEPLREQWSLIPIYLKATAGARDLFQDQRDKIFHILRQYLYACPFRFETDYWARTISGEEEGVYAWLTVNAIKGTFRSSRSEDTWGSMDMGGASVQVAFIPHDVSIIQNFFPLHLSYISVHLYAHSYLEFGYNAANQRIVRELMHRSAPAGGEPLAHPCFPAGVRFTQPLHEPFFVGHSSISVVGSGNLRECMHLARGLLDLNKPCFVPADSRDFANDSRASGACSIAGTYEPALYSQKFVAMGQFSKIAKSMGLPQRRLLPLSEWFEGMRRLCATDLAAVQFDAEVDNPEALSAVPVPTGYIPDPMGRELSRCWKAVWFWTVLRRGFRFPRDTRQIMFADSLEGKQVGWALGSMAYDVNYYPWGGQWHPGSLAEEVGLAAAAASPLAAASPPEGAAPATRAAGVTLGIALGLVLGLVLGLALGALWVRTPPSPCGRSPHSGGRLWRSWVCGGAWRHWSDADAACRLLQC